jgi:hypothetical protein
MLEAPASMVSFWARGPGREEFLHEAILHAASPERVKRGFCRPGGAGRASPWVRWRATGGDRVPGVSALVGDGKVGVEELSGLNVVEGQS